MTRNKAAIGNLILVIMFAAFMIYSAVTIVSHTNHIHTTKKAISQTASNYEKEQKRAQSLDEETAKIGTDEYVENQAKDKLGYVKSNEKIFYDKAQ